MASATAKEPLLLREDAEDTEDAERAAGRSDAAATAGAASTASSSSASPIVACGLPRDGVLAFATRILRMFNYGAIAPVFFLYCLEIGISEVQTGVLLTGILVGDLFITLWLSTRAERIGRKRVLVVASLLKVLAGAVFATTSNFYGLLVAGIVGVISTSGGEIGPFMAIEQACLTDAVLATKDASAATGLKGSGDVAVLLGWYNALGYAAQAVGALVSGVAVHQLRTGPLALPPLEAYRCVFVAYGVVGLLLALCYLSLTSAAEATPHPAPVNDTASSSSPSSSSPSSSSSPPGCCSWARVLLPDVHFGLRRPESKYIVARLSVMFAMDAFAGAFVLQTWIAFWFAKRWDFSSDLVGYLLMASNVVAGVSGIAAAFFVKKLGPMLTMIASHLPSNVLLIAVPFMPSEWAAAGMLVARFCISQMDVPARQAYVVMVVASDERSAAGGITNIVRSLGMSLAPTLLGYLSSAPRGSVEQSFNFNAPWIIAGAIKIAYDIILYSLYVCGRGLKENEAKAAAKDVAEAKARDDRKP